MSYDFFCAMMLSQKENSSRVVGGWGCKICFNINHNILSIYSIFPFLSSAEHSKHSFMIFWEKIYGRKENNAIMTRIKEKKRRNILNLKTFTLKLCLLWLFHRCSWQTLFLNIIQILNIRCNETIKIYK